MAVFPQALAVPMIRRHSRTAEEEHHYGPAVGVVSGNYVTGRRRGTVDGIDFGGTGSGEKTKSAVSALKMLANVPVSRFIGGHFSKYHF